MVRIAHLGDSHFDARSRFGECLCVHDWLVEDFDRRKIDLVLHGGDLFERKSEPAEHNEAIKWLQRVAEHRPVIGVRGNHDALQDLWKLNEIRANHPVVFEERADIHVAAGVAVAAVAWPRKAELLARLGDTSREAAEQAAQDALRNILRGLGQQFSQYNCPKVLLMHAQVCGVQIGQDQPLLVGGDMELALSDLALAGADFTCLSHIHLAQEWVYNEKPIVYAGSPYGRGYGEPEAKSYVVIDLPAGTFERVPTPYTPMILLENVWTGASGWRKPLVGEFHKADVRFRYRFDSDQRAAAQAAAKDVERLILGQGAVRVKLDPQEHATVRARASEVSTARTLPEKLEVLWKMRGEKIPPARKEALFAKVTILEEEVLNG